MTDTATTQKDTGPSRPFGPGTAHAAPGLFHWVGINGHAPPLWDGENLSAAWILTGIAAGLGALVAGLWAATGWGWDGTWAMVRDGAVWGSVLGAAVGLSLVVDQARCWWHHRAVRRAVDTGRCARVTAEVLAWCIARRPIAGGHTSRIAFMAVWEPTPEQDGWYLTQIHQDHEDDGEASQQIWPPVGPEPGLSVIDPIGTAPFGMGQPDADTPSQAPPSAPPPSARLAWRDVFPAWSYARCLRHRHQMRGHVFSTGPIPFHSAHARLAFHQRLMASMPAATGTPIDTSTGTSTPSCTAQNAMVARG